MKPVHTSSASNLFILPGIDGEVFSCNALSEALMIEGNIYGLKATDQEKTIEEIASYYIDQIQHFQGK